MLGKSVGAGVPSLWVWKVLSFKYEGKPLEHLKQRTDFALLRKRFGDSKSRNGHCGSPGKTGWSLGIMWRKDRQKSMDLRYFP